MIFVDRKKNVIRRSGENIAAVEVENTLLRHPLVDAVAIAAVDDPVRGEEIFACIVTGEKDMEPERAAREIVSWCLERLAYYKAPGFVSFVEQLPVTATNKVKRGEIKSLVARQVESGHVVDTRPMKIRSVA